MSPEAWNFLEKCLTLLIVPVVMWYLNRVQTAKIAKTQAEAATEVKTELAVAKTELKQHADVREAKLDAVAEAVVVAVDAAVGAEKAANGNLEKRDRRIADLERQLLKKGIKPKDTV
jgi:hypothetical protein